MDYELITTDQALANFCTCIANAPYCAIDTEFVREKTYYPLFALLQIATEQHIACIDPLAIQDFSPLIGLLRTPELVKVFHAPSQDLDILYQQFGILPTPVFDTQLAAAVLGFPHQISYAELVLKITSVCLPKKYTRANWYRRPLSDAELNYAINDVRYLLPVYRRLKQALDDKHRSSWIKQDLVDMSKPSNYQIDMDCLWLKLKDRQKLNGVEKQIAQQLCIWREKTAQQQNRPRRWITSDDCIINIARKKPADREALTSMQGMNDKILDKYGYTWLEIVSEARQTDPSYWPQQKPPIILSVQQQALGDCLMALCRIIAEDHDIALAALATRKDIDKLILNRKTSRLAQGWHFQIAGQKLLDFIHAQSWLGVDNDGHIRNIPRHDMSD